MVQIIWVQSSFDDPKRYVQYLTPSGVVRIDSIDPISTPNSDQLLSDDRLTELAKLTIISGKRRSYEKFGSVTEWLQYQAHIESIRSWLAADIATDDGVTINDDLLLVVEETDQNRNAIPQYIDEIVKGIDSLPPGWDIWLLDPERIRDAKVWSSPDPTPLSSAVASYPNMEVRVDLRSEPLDVRSFWGAGAYIIRRHAAETLIEKAYPAEGGFDAYIGIRSQLGEIRVIDSGFRLSTKVQARAQVQAKSQHGADVANLSQEDSKSKRIFWVMMFITLLVLIPILIRIIYNINIYYIPSKWIKHRIAMEAVCSPLLSKVR